MGGFFWFATAHTPKPDIDLNWLSDSALTWVATLLEKYTTTRAYVTRRHDALAPGAGTEALPLLRSNVYSFSSVGSAVAGGSSPVLSSGAGPCHHGGMWSLCSCHLFALASHHFLAASHSLGSYPPAIRQ